jgi:hypothetical protein
MMRVLIACERSGVVRRAFAALGHDAWSCDLEPADDGSPRHIQGDALALARAQPWDLMIAHPPCTYVAASGWHRTVRGLRPASATDAAIAFFHALARLAAIPRRALENPVGVISSRLGPPTQIVQPWQFGDDASKATCLWLYGLQPLQPTQILRRHRYANQTASGQNRLSPGPDRARLRSQTYPGLAAAMAEQWSEPLAFPF